MTGRRKSSPCIRGCGIMRSPSSRFFGIRGSVSLLPYIWEFRRVKYHDLKIFVILGLVNPPERSMCKYLQP